jgi:hypothetical protein
MGNYGSDLISLKPTTNQKEKDRQTEANYVTPATAAATRATKAKGSVTLVSSNTQCRGFVIQSTANGRLGLLLRAGH